MDYFFIVTIVVASTEKVTYFISRVLVPPMSPDHQPLADTYLLNYFDANIDIKFMLNNQLSKYQ